MQQYDFLIIGQGLAGSLLAYSLIKRGCTVLVIDNKHKGSSTQVAAGLINPVTGHRLNITDRFFEFNAKAKKMYWQIERDLDCNVYRDLNQTRLIKNAGQAGYLSKRLQQTDYHELLLDIKDTGDWFSNEQSYPFGAINIASTAVVDTKTLLHRMHQWLDERDAIKRLAFNYDGIKSKRIKPKVSMIEYHDHGVKLQAKKIVFCEGYQAINNPWLSALPFKFAKGEVLTLKPQTTIDRMLSWGKWLIPFANGRAKLGSNYIWNDLSLAPTEGTATKFLAEFEEHTNTKAELIDHEVGIRPSTTQRKPFVGPITGLENAYCLNGLGSKGCLIAPHYAQLLCDHMLSDALLPDEVTQWL